MLVRLMIFGPDALRVERAPAHDSRFYNPGRVAGLVFRRGAFRAVRRAAGAHAGPPTFVREQSRTAHFVVFLVLRALGMTGMAARQLVAEVVLVAVLRVVVP